MIRDRHSTATREPSTRLGVSLLELIAVVAILGVISAGVVSRFGRDAFGSVGVRGEARRLSLGLLEAQRCAIRTGDDHGIRTYGSTNSISAWEVVREYDDGSREVGDGPYSIPDDYQVQVDTSEIFFDFEGNGRSSFNVRLDGPKRYWQLRVFPLTRMIDCQEITP